MPTRLIPLLAIAALAGCAAGCGSADPASLAVTSQREDRSRIDEEQPPHPEHLDVATPAQERAAEEEEVPEPATPATPPPPVPTGDDMPPASAGTNGSYTPPPPSERTRITPQTIERIHEDEAEGRAILLNGIALAPPGAPEAVQAVVSAANEIVGRPYIWGGGHSSWYSRGWRGWNGSASCTRRAC